MLRILESDADGNGSLTLDELAREGARRVSALDAEVADYIDRHHKQRDGADHALVVRNDKAKKRRGTLGAGTVEIEAPRVHDSSRGAALH